MPFPACMLQPQPTPCRGSTIYSCSHYVCRCPNLVMCAATSTFTLLLLNNKGQGISSNVGRVLRQVQGTAASQYATQYLDYRAFCSYITALNPTRSLLSHRSPPHSVNSPSTCPKTLLVSPSSLASSRAGHVGTPLVLLVLRWVPVDAVEFGAQSPRSLGCPGNPGGDSIHHPPSRVLQPDLHPAAVRYCRCAVRTC